MYHRFIPSISQSVNFCGASAECKFCRVSEAADYPPAQLSYSVEEDYVTSLDWIKIGTQHWARLNQKMSYVQSLMHYENFSKQVFSKLAAPPLKIPAKKKQVENVTGMRKKKKDSIYSENHELDKTNFLLETKTSA